MTLGSHDLGVAAADDHGVGALVLARLVALGQHRPRGNRVARCRLLALAASVRMVDRVLRHAAHRRAHAAPAHAPRLADRLERMLLVADFADGRAAVDVHLADLAGTQPDLRVLAFPREQLHRGAGSARELRALARQHLDAVNGGADRDVPERQGVAGLDRRFRTGDELRPRGYALGRDDVAPLSVRIQQQREKSAAIGAVFEALDLRRDGVLVALEIDPADFALDHLRYRPALVELGVDDLDLLALAGGDGSHLDQHYLASACSAK